MKKVVVTTLIVISMAVCAVASDRKGAALDRVETSSTILNQIMSAPDRAIPDGIMNGAKCIAIVPSDLKASFIIGANYGKGVATCRTEHGWSAPVFIVMNGGSFGFQAGGQATDLVLIIRTDQGMQHLLQSRFKLGSDASAAAGPVGRNAQAGTDLTMRAQILTYSRARGLFLGVSLAGAVIRQDEADTHAFYGQTWTFRSLLNGEVAAPKDAQPLLNTVEKYAPTPKVRAQASAPAAASASSTVTPAASATPVAPATTTATPQPAAAPAEVETPEAAPEPATQPTPDATPSPAASTAATPEPSSSSLAPNKGNR